MHSDWILMLDADQTVPERALMSFYEIMMSYKHNYIETPLIAILDCPNHGVDDTNIYYHPDGSLAHFTISCALIHKDVFKAVGKPYFRSDLAYIEDGKKDGKILYRTQMKTKDDNIGEDIYFSKKVLEAGIKVEVIPLKCNHYELKGE